MSTKSFKVIVIEDDPQVSEIIKGILEQEPCDILMFQNSEDFFSAFDHNKVQLAIINDDLNEIDVDGLYVLKNVMKRDRQLKVIALSSNDSVQRVLQYMDNDAWRFISKNDPLWSNKIESNVKEAIREAKCSKLMEEMSYENALELIIKRDEMLTTFFNDFPALFAILDSKGAFQMVNDRWKELGWTRADLKRIHIQDIIHGKAQDMINSYLINPDVNKAELDCMIVSKTGDRITINWQMVKHNGNMLCIGKLR